MIDIVIVENSQPRQELLAELFSGLQGMQVVATAKAGDEAVELIVRLRPTIALISHQLPKLDGLDATRLIMQTSPLPIIIVTGNGSPGEVASTFDAVDAGALAVLPRPGNLSPSDRNLAVKELLQTVRVMSEVKVIRRWPKYHLEQVRPAPPPGSHAQGQLKIVAIGASTGGPLALATILAGLPRNFPVPITVVQHMTDGFMRGFVDWLAPSSALPVHIATHGERMFPGHVYMAPDNVHLQVAQGNRIALVTGNLESGVRPSVASLFRSVAQLYGNQAVAILLTGMGRDGANELLELKNKGGITFAQDKASSIVHGMPGEAIKLGAATHILTPKEIALALGKLSGLQPNGDTK